MEQKLKFEDTTDPHMLFKLLKTQKVSYNDFTPTQIYIVKESYSHLFDDCYNELPKEYDEDIRSISQSQIQLYKDCERMWYMKYWLGVSQEVRDDSYLRFGRSCHTILEHFYENIDMDMAKQDSVSHFEYILNKILFVKHWDFSLKENMKNDAEQIFRDFAYVFGSRFNELVASKQEHLFFPVSVEDDIKSTTHPLRAIVDRINPGYKTFGDYKTNKKFPEILLADTSRLNREQINEYNIVSEPYAIQAAINAMCIYDKYKVMPERCLFIFIRHLTQPHGGIVTIPITQNLIDQVTTYVNRIFTSVKEHNFKKNTTTTRCTDFGGCPYTTACDAMELCIVDL